MQSADTIHVVLTKLEITFGFRESARIVGGEKRLKTLIEQGQVRTNKKSEAQNGRWACNASDVLMYAKIRI